MARADHANAGVVYVQQHTWAGVRLTEAFLPKYKSHAHHTGVFWRVCT